MKLFPHQEAALQSTEGQNRVAYYLDMGLGKTFLGSEKAVKMGSKIILVVCQKSKVQDWIDHFAEHYMIGDIDKSLYPRDLTVKSEFENFLVHVNEVQDGSRYVGVINYDLIWRRKILLNLKNFTLVLDESSLIQNRKSNRSKFILKMEPENVVLLSGTPTGGKYENLWTQLHLLGWDISENLYNAQYVNWKNIKVGGMVHKIVNKDDPYKNVERLKQKMREHGAVFMKTEDVFDLPEQNFINVSVPTTKEYKKFKKDQVVTVNGGEFVGDSLLSFRLYQRQLCTAYNPNKVDAFKDILDSTQDRLIVFYQFNCELDVLVAACKDAERPYSIISGHHKDLTAYETESNSVTLVQYQAGAMGLNLQKANKIVYFSLTESAEIWMQAHKRIHRIGQKKPCFYYILVCKDSIEERILDCLNRGVDYTDDLFRKEDEN